VREIADVLRCWHAVGAPYALATVVAVQGSAPREIGAALAVDAAGSAAGSVSGGCVEAEVYELCREVLRTGEPVRRRFAADPADPFAPALTCGGTIDILIRRVDPATDTSVLDALRADRAAAPRLLVFGAVEFAAALVRVGRVLGYRVTVCDARPVFASPERFPEADEVVVAWPHRYLAATAVDSSTAICVLTHDAKFDVPVLLEALRRPAGYIGAVGSRRTCADRAARLRDAGSTEAELARLRSPIGLDLGGVTPEEVALSIGAEIVAVTRGGSGRPLRETRGPLHHRGPQHSPTTLAGV
jgi:xanthine dehydrogenase accessory factor